jgi:hypothetical protein
VYGKSGSGGRAERERERERKKGRKGRKICCPQHNFSLFLSLFLSLSQSDFTLGKNTEASSTRIGTPKTCTGDTRGEGKRAGRERLLSPLSFSEKKRRDV